ncbi:unnamed protein product [Rhizoctonia solani]|uniref:Protein kinase domain-containing protein n=1 Tax=Rhizoctonia solani TaxID=456999 RepID=A0A8H3GJB6_9AGAM|nr:unnamed protein product [Rhizoctonia solani]
MHISLCLAEAFKIARNLRILAEIIPIWAKCNHPNIVPLIGEATVRGQVAAVYEWLTYGSVLDYLKRHPTADRHQLSAKICDGVAYLHANNIIHGNLKGSQVFVSDYGVPRIMLDCTGTHMVGKPRDIDEMTLTLRWAAPEILMETSGKTFQSDVYALGMETISLSTPYNGMSDYRVVSNVMRHIFPSRPMDTISDNEAGNVLWDLLTACWSQDPKERPSAADIGEVMNALGSSQPATQVHQRPRSSMGFAPNTVIEDLVAFFVNNNLTDYTEELKRSDMKIQLSKPYLATAAALLFKIDLPIKGDHRNTIHIQKVVVKRVMNESPYKQLKRATRELYFWSGYKHDNILPLLGFAVLDGNLAMISPWIENGSVTEYVRKQQKPDYHDLCTQLSCAICYLHGHGLIHGDIKGDNVLVSDEGIVKVTDFGVSIAAQLQIEFTFTAVGRGTERWQVR